MIHLQVIDDDGQADRTLDLDMIHLKVAVELSEIDHLDDDEALPQRIRL